MRDYGLGIMPGLLRISDYTRRHLRHAIQLNLGSTFF